MKSKLILMVLAGIVCAGVAGAVDHASVGVGQGVVIPDPLRENPCPGSDLYQNHDDSFENGCMWRYGGIVPPYYGAFAEGFEGAFANIVCGVALWLTTLPGYFSDQAMDCYVWDSDGTNPTNVLSVTTNIHITPPALWPDISRHDIPINFATSSQPYFVGYWGDWPGNLGGWFVAADLDGFGGLPRTNLAPGSGYGTGWADPSIVWGPIQALGIGSYAGMIVSPPPTAVGDVPVRPSTRTTTWGRIKGNF